MPLFQKDRKNGIEGKGVILLEDVPEAIKAEKILKKSGYRVKLVAPPPSIRKGCDLAVQIDLVEQVGIARLLGQNNAPFLDILPLKEGTSPLLDMVKATDFGDSIMVKAGNMKISFDKASGLILNTSGGGCPDIPYLNIKLVGKKVTEAPKPKSIGFTLCALMANRALEECIRLWQKQHQK